MIEDVDDLQVAEVLSDNQFSYFVVPKYQREYVWGQSDWDALVDDLIENESTDGHFLGTYLAVNQEKGSHHVPRYDVVDGQQRLTTLSLMLAAIYKVLAGQTDKDEDQIVELAKLRKMLVIDKKPRLTPQDSGTNRADYFAVLASAGLDLAPKPKTPNNFGNRRIAKAFRLFETRIKNRAGELETSETEAARDLLNRVRRAVLVKLEVATYSDAFKLFESLNNRGKPLTPIDLIKNTLLARAERTDGVSLDSAYEDWTTWLERLGDDYGTQERFFRQFYNAMKDVWGLALVGAPVATRSNLIKIYEDQISKNLVGKPATEESPAVQGLLTALDRATEQYEKLIKNVDDAWTTPTLERAFADLVRAEGTTAHVLLLYLLLLQDRRELTDEHLVSIVKLLTAFSVRRNMTNAPPTNALQRLFMEIIGDIEQAAATGEEVRALILAKLKDRSSDDDDFRKSLVGAVYDEHANVARFILVQLAKADMTKETWQDLWARDQNKTGDASFRWTIEHILPQSEALISDWVDMLGGPEAAKATQERFVHYLGNLTISGYNASLGKRSFIDKRDREDDSGNYIGYRNGLSLNKELAERANWNEAAIIDRTEDLVDTVVAAFPLV